MVTKLVSELRRTATLASALVWAFAALCLTGCSNGADHSGARTLVRAAQTASRSAFASQTPSADPMTAAALPATAIPVAAWIDPASIPLDRTYRWTAPASVARSVKSPMLGAVRDCGLTLRAAAEAELAAFPAAQADLTPTTGTTGGRDDWRAQETILATDDTSSGDVQGIYGLYDDLVAVVKKCAAKAAGSKLTAAVSQGPGYAATITVLTSTGSTLTWHEYLAAPYGYLVELSVWVAPYAGDKPGSAWDGTAPRTVLSALRAGPCALTKLCNL